MGGIKGDTRSLDSSSHVFMRYPLFPDSHVPNFSSAQSFWAELVDGLGHNFSFFLGVHIVVF